MHIDNLNAQWSENLEGCKQFPGILNSGLTCFANSILQVFNHTPAMINHFKHHERVATCEEGDECCHCLMKDYFKQFEYCQKKNISIGAKNLVSSLMSNTGIQLKKGRMNDSEEFFMAIANKLEDPSTKKSILNEIYGTKIANVYCCKCCGNIWKIVTTEHLNVNKGNLKERLAEKCEETSKLFA